MNIAKVLGSRQLVAAAQRRATVCAPRMLGVRSMSDYHDPDYKPFHWDQMPVPQGSWQADYDRHQKTYNIVLAFGLTFLAGTLYFVTQSGFIFFNAKYPHLPELEVQYDGTRTPIKKDE